MFHCQEVYYLHGTLTCYVRMGSFFLTQFLGVPPPTKHPIFLSIIRCRIIDAISTLKERTGSSKPAIWKFVSSKVRSCLAPVGLPEDFRVPSSWSITSVMSSVVGTCCPADNVHSGPQDPGPGGDSEAGQGLLQARGQGEQARCTS